MKISILLLVATLLTCGCNKMKDRFVLEGVVKNSNVLKGGVTEISFAKDDDPDHAFPMIILGRHPEIWPGEHVRLNVSCCDRLSRYELNSTPTQLH